jgi:hypothetical protein
MLNYEQISMTPGDPHSQITGLCADCIYATKIQSSKGSVFLLCELSKTDPRFPKYPRLPVLSCTGYERAPK